MIFDALVLLLGTLAFIRGWQKGLLWAVFSLIAVLLGIFIALKFSQLLTDFLFSQEILAGKYTLPLSFLILFLTVLFGFRLLIKFIESLLEKILLGWANRLLGGLLYSGFVLLVFSVFCWLCNQSGLLSDTLKQESKSFTIIEPIAPKTVELSSKYLPLCQDLYRKHVPGKKEISDEENGPK